MASLPRLELGTHCLEGSCSVANLLNKLSVSELAQLSKLSKSYISQVKNGRRPPSTRLIDALSQHPKANGKRWDYLNLFIQSRKSMGVSPRTVQFYQERLSKFADRVNYLTASRQHIERYLGSIPPNERGLATRHASFRAIKTLYRWLSAEYGMNNPVEGMSAPMLGKPIMPSLSRERGANGMIGAGGKGPIPRAILG